MKEGEGKWKLLFRVQDLGFRVSSLGFRWEYGKENGDYHNRLSI